MTVAAPTRKRFAEWRDLVVTPMVEAAVLAAAGLVTYAIQRRVAWGPLGACAIFYAAQLVVATLVVRALRAWWPAREGVHLPGSTQRYVFNLVGFLSGVNLHLFFFTDLVPPFFRALVYGALGARIGDGIIVIGGRIGDPALVSIGSGALLGEGSLLLGHAIANHATHDDVLVLGRVEIGDGALVGARAVLMPGVRVGAHAMVQPMSLVTIGTRIGDYEVWGGCPAHKVGDLRQSQ